MARRSFGYPRYAEPQQQEVVGVPYISMYNPQDYQDYSKILEQGQQRYDISQSAIAKYMEDYANAQVAERNIPALENIVQDRLKDIQTLVDKKYSGQYGNAANEIVQQLALARKPIVQAQVDYANEMRAREEFNKNQPGHFVMGKNNKPEWVPYTFEQYHNLEGKPSFTEEGKFKPTSFMATRGRGEGDKWAMENISNPIMQKITSGNIKALKDEFGDMAEVISQRGMTDDEVDKYIDERPWIVDSFLQNSKWSKEEFSNPDGSINYDLATDYLKDIVKLQTVKGSQSDYRNIPRSKGSDGDNVLDLTSEIFGEDYNTRNEVNPYVEEKGSYTKALDKKGWFTGSYEDIQTAINELEELEGYSKKNTRSNRRGELTEKYKELYPGLIQQITEEGPMSKRVISNLDKEVKRLKALQEDFTSAKEALKQEYAKEVGGKPYESLSDQDKKKVDIRLPKTTKELASLMDSDESLLTQSISTSNVISHPVTQKKIRESIVNHFEDMDFGSSYGGTSTYFNDVVEDMGGNPQAIKEYIRKNEDIVASYQKARGQYYIDVPTKVDDKGNPDSKNPKYKRLYFTLGAGNKYSYNVLSTMTSAIMNKSKDDKIIVDDGVKFLYRYIPEFNTSPKDKSEQKIQIFLRDGNPLKDKDGNNKYIGLEELQDRMKNFQKGYLASQYTIPYLSARQQKQYSEEE